MKKLISIMGILILLVNFFPLAAVLADDPVNIEDSTWSDVPPLPVIKITIDGQEYKQDEIIEYQEGSTLNVRLEWYLDTSGYHFSGQEFTYQLGSDLNITTKRSPENPGLIYEGTDSVGTFWIDDDNVIYISLYPEFVEDDNRDIYLNLSGVLPGNEREGQDSQKREFKIGEVTVTTNYIFNESSVTLAKRTSSSQYLIKNQNGQYEVEFQLLVTFDGKVSDLIITDIPDQGLILPDLPDGYRFYFNESVENENVNVTFNPLAFNFEGTFYPEDEILIIYTAYVDEETARNLFESKGSIGNTANGTYTDNRGTSGKKIDDTDANVKAEVRFKGPSFYKSGHHNESDQIEWTISFNSGSLGDLKALLDDFGHTKEIYGITEVSELWDKLGLGPITDEVGEGLSSLPSITYEEIVQNGSEERLPDGSVTYTYKYLTNITQSQGIYKNKVTSSFFGEDFKAEGNVGAKSDTFKKELAEPRPTEDGKLKWKITVGIPDISVLTSLSSYQIVDIPKIPYVEGSNSNFEIYGYKHRAIVGSVKIQNELPAFFNARVTQTKPTDDGIGLVIDFDTNDSNFQLLAGHEIEITLETEIVNSDLARATTAFLGNVVYYNEALLNTGGVRSGQSQAEYLEEADELITKNVVGNWKSEDKSGADWYIEITKDALNTKGGYLEGFFTDNQDSTMTLTDTLPAGMTYVQESERIGLSTFDLSLRIVEEEDVPENLDSFYAILGDNLSIVDNSDGTISINWTLTKEQKEKLLKFKFEDSYGNKVEVQDGLIETNTDGSSAYGIPWINSKVRIYYRTEVKPRFYEDMKSEAAGGNLFVNTAEGKINDVETGEAVAAVRLYKQGMLEKGYIYNLEQMSSWDNDESLDPEYRQYLKSYRMNGSGFFNVYFRVDVNPQKLIISGDGNGTIILEDEMTKNLSLIIESIRITDVETGDVFSSEDHKVKVDFEKNSFSVELPEGRHYILEYFTAIDPTEVGSNKELGNTIRLKGVVEERSDWSITPDIALEPFGGANRSKSVDVYKFYYDEDGGIHSLNDARFVLKAYTYDPDLNQLVDIDKSQENQDFPNPPSDYWDEKTTNPTVSWVNLHQNYVYEIKEVQAPEGYQIKEQYYYFVFTDYDDLDSHGYLSSIEELIEQKGYNLNQVNPGERIEIENIKGNDDAPDENGSLKIIKNLAENAPDEAQSKDYIFTIKGPGEVAGNTYDGVEFDSDCKATVTIEGADFKTISGLPVGQYTITENIDEADIEGYILKATGGGTVDIIAGQTLEVAITNTYTKETNTPTTGNLQVTKAFGKAVPEGADSKFFTFTVSGPIELVAGKTYDDVTFNEEGKATITIKGYGSKLIKGLPIGTYSVSEDKDGAIISGYYLTVTGEGNVEITANSEPKNITITNNYSEGPAFNEDELGNLTLNKVISGDIPEDKYKDKVFTFVVTGPKEIAGKFFAGYDFDENGKTTVTITGQNSITLAGLPTGIYRVEEFGNTAIEGYAWTVDITDEGQVAITKDSEETVTITNNYEDPSGNLTIKKKIQGNAKGTDTKVYDFTITGPSSIAGVGFELADESETIEFTDSETPTAQVQITGSGSATITGLPYGTYTVKENRDSAQINGYILTVSGESSVTFDTESSDNQTVTITNSYSEPSNNTPNTPGPTPQPNPNPGNTPEYKPEDIQKPDNPSTPDNNETTTAPKLTIYKEQSVQRNNQENYEQSYDGQRTTSYIEVREGDIVTYYLTVKNSGNETAQNVVITDPVPEGLIIIEDSATRKENLVISGNTLTWMIDSIPANGTVSIEVQFKIQVPEIKQEIYWKNTAFVNYKDNPNGPIYSNTVTIGDPPVDSSPADTEIVTPNDVNSTDSTNTVEQAVNKSTTTTTTSVGVTSTGVSPQTGITGGISVFVLIIIAAVLVLLDQKRKDIIKQKSQGKE